MCKDKTGTISRKRVVTRVMTIAAHCTLEKKRRQCSIAHGLPAKSHNIVRAYSDFFLGKYASKSVPSRRNEV